MLAKKALSSTASAPKLFVEDVFSCTLYTGNGSTQTITNGIDLSGEGGLVWGKDRGDTVTHQLVDTVRGGNKSLSSADTNAQGTNSSPYILTFNNNGYESSLLNNENLHNFVSWTFRKAEKFFDVVTYTGNGTAGRTVSHNLGSVPGCIIVKCTSEAQSWAVYHRSLGNDKRLILQTTAAATTTTTWNSTDPTSTVFSVDDGDIVNKNGATYVAYLFAHDAGGFGDSGSESVIKCGSYTGNGSTTGPEITLGYEPQWVLIKNATGTGGESWFILDNMRGFSNTQSQLLFPNSSAAEYTWPLALPNLPVIPTATGFRISTADPSANESGKTFIYIAIRRGPMKTPEAGTEVFEPFVDRTSIGNKVNGTMGPVDLGLQTQVSTPFSAATHFTVNDRLRGDRKLLATSTTDAEGTGGFYFDTNQGVRNESWFTNGGVGYNFKRAPGFMDVVCYSGNGGTGSRSITHNLGKTPEFIIIKRRDSTNNWATGSMFTSTTVTRAVLNANNDQDLNSAYTGQSIWGGQPTSSAFLVDASGSYNTNTATYVAYLFATLAGVSKVGSYTGNGSSQTINCGFTGGARFVLIKRTDSTGDWVVFDSARGIVSGNDPALYLNSTAAEVTTADAIDTDSTGFVVNQESTLNVNVNSASYIYLSIA